MKKIKNYILEEQIGVGKFGIGIFAFFYNPNKSLYTIF